MKFSDNEAKASQIFCDKNVSILQIRLSKRFLQVVVTKSIAFYRVIEELHLQTQIPRKTILIQVLFIHIVSFKFHSFSLMIYTHKKENFEISV